MKQILDCSFQLDSPKRIVMPHLAEEFVEGTISRKWLWKAKKVLDVASKVTITLERNKKSSRYIEISPLQIYKKISWKVVYPACFHNWNTKRNGLPHCQFSGYFQSCRDCEARFGDRNPIQLLCNAEAVRVLASAYMQGLEVVCD